MSELDEARGKASGTIRRLEAIRAKGAFATVLAPEELGPLMAFVAALEAEVARAIAEPNVAVLLEIPCDECEGKGCDDCDGLGMIPVGLGRKVLELVGRHFGRGAGGEEIEPQMTQMDADKDKS